MEQPPVGSSTSMTTSFSILLLSAILVTTHAVVLRGSQLPVNTEPQIRKPLTDKREYKHGELPNGLRVLAVQDPHAAKSGFSVAVSAGSFYDPIELPGLAHFCEHLLFLGTKKYPDESSFDTFLSQHDGSNNAYTTQERTVYYNEVSHTGLDEAVDRFAQFFVAPLFKHEMVPRELEAVNSEHQKNIPNQGRKFWELMRSLSGNASVLGRFYTGTTESLHHGDDETVAALRKYHSENYCAPRMRLVLISNRSTEEQLALAHKHFSEVQSAGTQCSPTPQNFDAHFPFNTDSAQHGELAQLLEFRTDSAPQFWMMFPLRSTTLSYAAQPGSMLQYLLAYSGPGSLKSKIKATGLASDMQVQVDQTSVATLVFVTFDLTAQGATRAGAASISALTFDYLSQLRANSTEVIKDVYPSVQKMSMVTFDYQEAPDTVMDASSSLAEAMLSYSPADVLAGDTVIDSVNIELVSSLVQGLTPSNVDFALATSDFNEERDGNRYEKYYDLKYAHNPAPADMLGTSAPGSGTGSLLVLKTTKANTTFPPALRYVPAQLAVLSESAGEAPENFGLRQGVEVWWLGRGRFPLPKTQLRVRLAVSEEMATSAEFTALRRLHVELTRQGLEEPMEDLTNCGLDWNLDEASDGYMFSMNGYDEHVPSLVKMVSSGFSQPPLEPARFEQARQRVLQELDDKTSKMPYEHAMEALAVVSSSAAYSSQEIADALRSVDSKKMQDYLTNLKSKGVQAQLLVTGNVGAAKAKELGDVLAKELDFAKSFQGKGVARSRVLKANRAVEVRMPNPISGDVNSATINAYQFGVPDVSERVKLLMLGNMFSQDSYDTLRTQQQLGYVVFGVVMPHHTILELRVIVQGAKETPDVVDVRIESLLQTFRHNLDNISTSDFQRWKSSLRSTLSKHDENMGEEADRLWGKITTGNLCFKQQQMALEYLDTMESPKDLAAEFQEILSSHRKVSVRLFGAGKDQKSHLASSSSASATSLAVVVNGDSAKDKTSIASAEGSDFWPEAGICQIHRSD